MTNKTDEPIAKAQLLIRKPVRQVFEALVDPAITSRFGFQKVVADLKLESESGGIGRCMLSILTLTLRPLKLTSAF